MKLRASEPKHARFYYLRRAADIAAADAVIEEPSDSAMFVEIVTFMGEGVRTAIEKGDIKTAAKRARVVAQAALRLTTCFMEDDHNGT